MLNRSISCTTISPKTISCPMPLLLPLFIAYLFKTTLNPFDLAPRRGVVSENC